MQQEQWERVIEKLKQAREDMAKQYEANMQKIDSMVQEASQSNTNQAVAWMQSQLGKTNNPAGQPPKKDEDPYKQTLLEQLKKQQEDIQRQIIDLTSEESKPAQEPLEALRRTITGTACNRADQEVLIEQLRTALAPKETEKDSNRALLKTLITAQKKTMGVGGSSTLRTDTLNKLSSEPEFSMAEWLASLNKQEGESEISRLLGKNDDEFDCRAECKHGKMRSGMLDKSTTNIQCKEVWPQKNLGEDWAEEEIELKQLRFEHLVAGETRTIETCVDPAQIFMQIEAPQKDHLPEAARH